MNTDIRINIGFLHHKKTLRLKRSLGSDGIIGLLQLWLYVGQHQPLGILNNTDNIDLAAIAEYAGDPETFERVLLETGFIHKIEGGYEIHEWREHNPWAFDAPKRSENARKGAIAMHKKRKEHAQGMLPASKRHATSNAPSPSPSPSPKRNTRIVSDKFYELFKSRNDNRKPGWGAKETKAVKELFERYPDDTDSEIASVFEWIYKHPDKLWDDHLGSFISLTGKFFDRARSDMLKSRPKKNNKPAVCTCQECGAVYNEPMEFCFRCRSDKIIPITREDNDGLQKTTTLA